MTQFIKWLGNHQLQSKVMRAITDQQKVAKFLIERVVQENIGYDPCVLDVYCLRIFEAL